MTNQLRANLSLLAVTVVWGASFPIMSIAFKIVPLIYSYKIFAFRLDSRYDYYKFKTIQKG
jgi:hypothetical protein